MSRAAPLPGAVSVEARVTTASGVACVVDLGAPLDISIAARPYDAHEARVRAFHLPRETAPPAQFGDTAISVDAGSSVNCPVPTMCFHSSVTHTECVGHMLPGKVTLYDVPRRR